MRIITSILPALVLVLMGFYQPLTAQRYVNEDWSSITGLPLNIHWSSSMIASTGHIITVGNTFTSGQSTNVLLTKYATNGDIIWQVEYDNPDNLEDYGIAVCEDNSGNFYVAGTSFRSSSSSLELSVLKFNSSGVNQWAYFFDGSAGGDDIPAEIVTDGTNVYVTGGTESSSTASDYVTIKLKDDGTVLWTKYYDHNSLDDVAVEVDINQSGDIIVSGGSADQANLYDMATVKYDASGNEINVHRSNYNVGIDQPTGFDIDAGGNAIVGGYYVPAPGEMKISIISLDDTLGLNWSKLHDPSDGEDKIMGLVTDASGNIYVTGHVEESPGYFKCYTAKFDNTGTLVWEEEYQSPSGGAFGKAITLSSNGFINVAGMNYDAGSSDTNIITLIYKPDGTLITSKEHDAGGTEIASNLETDYWGNIYVHGTSSSNGNGYVTVKYSFFDRPLTPFNDTIDSAEYVDNEMIIMFKAEWMDSNKVDDKGKTFGQLSDFVKQAAIDSLNEVFEGEYDFGRMMCVKANSNLRTWDTISISRLGDTIEMPHFWSVLTVMVPGSFQEIDDAALITDELYPDIHFAEPNYIGYLHSQTNDSLFVDGYFEGFHDTVPIVGRYADINMPEAWEIETGHPDIRVGVYDSGINWAHEDFSLTGSGTFSDSKISDGKDYTVSPSSGGVHISNVPIDTSGHGTYVAGIIGALRNNHIGAPGVAGGDMTVNNPGVQLLGFKVYDSEIEFITQEDMNRAIIEGARDTLSGIVGYGLHIQNHSWGQTQQSAYLREAVEFCAQNKCALVASSGNDLGQVKYYPASDKDEWVMKTGGSNSLGMPGLNLTYGNQLDFIAPANSNLYYCLSGEGNTYVDEDPSGLPIEGTSFAAPHASGLAALLTSYNYRTHGWFLAPEDIEHLIQNYAFDIVEPSSPMIVGYDPNTGWGRIQADSSLQMITAPKFTLVHKDTTLSWSVATPIASNQTVILSRNYNGIAVGTYKADIYEFTVNIPIDNQGKTVIDAWKRDASSTLFANTAVIVPDRNVSVNSFNQSSVAMTGYAYILKDFFSLTLVGVIPNDDPKLAFTYHLDQVSFPLASEVGHQSNSQVHLYPNPSGDRQLLTVTGIEENQKIELTMMDLSGRVVKQQQAQSNGRGEVSMQIDLTDIPSGLYIYQIDGVSFQQTIRTIVNK